MKKVILLSLFLIVSQFLTAQKDKTEKLKSFYEKKEYVKCIETSEKILEKDAKNTPALFYGAFSYFAQFKSNQGKERTGFLKSALKNLDIGVKTDKENLFLNATEMSEIKDTLRNTAYYLYKRDKEKSKSYFNHLAKIYKDTTDEYLEFYMPEKVRPDKAIVALMEQGLLNQTDEKGLKQGHWQKVYPNGSTAYDVFFIDDKPTGVFKRFHENGKLQSILKYREKSDVADGEIFDENGILTGKGKFIGKSKDSLWTYYNEQKRIVKTEEYKNGALNGKTIIYYKDEKPYDERTYINGLQNGAWTVYLPEGRINFKAEISEDKRNGLYIKYYPSGEIEMKGKYIADIPNGIWEYYDEKGKKTTITYKDGKAANQAALDAAETELYKKTIEESKRIIDPQDYMRNPDEYNNLIQNK